jgi:hypothetical protein
VLEEVKAWQDRPLEALDPIVYLDGQPGCVYGGWKMMNGMIVDQSVR